MSEVPSYRDDPVMFSIIQARSILLMRKPFYGQMALRLQIVLLDGDTWCNTAATDGRRLYFNRSFAKKLNHNQMLFVVAHEAMHCVLMHMLQRGTRDPKVWNMAGDALINYMLKQDGVGEFIKEGVIYDERYSDELTTVEIYNLMMENSTVVQIPFDQHLDAASGKLSGDEDEGGKEPGEQGSVGVRVMGEDGPPELSEEEREELESDIRSSLMAAVMAGNVPKGVKRLIDALAKPIMDWRSMLDAHIRSAQKSDLTYRRMSRRSFGSAFLLRGQAEEETIDIACTVDTSGSMSDEMIKDLFTEIRGIMESFADFKVRIWTFDTKVYGYKEFTPQNIEELDTYVPEGGGGTSFEVSWDFMKQNEIIPNRLIFFTDGYPGSSWGEADYCDTLFIIHGNKSIVPPFGTYAYYEPKAVVKTAR